MRRRAGAAISAAALALAGCGPGAGAPGARPPATRPPETSAAAPGATTAGGPAASVPSGRGAPGGHWLVFGGDPAHTGVDASSPPAGSLRPAWRRRLDGNVLAEPLIDGAEVVVATENDSLYGLDLATGAVRWRAHLGTPVPGSTLPCGDINPSGITGTPVIDPATATVWAVVFVETASGPHHVLVGLDAATGAVRRRIPADPPGGAPAVEQQRAALVLDGGRVAIAFGGLFGDCGAYHGVVEAVDVTGSAPTVSWVVPTARQGGIWAPSGPTVVGGGDLLVATGNGASRSRFDDANAVVRLSPSLVARGVFAPADWAALSAADEDLGSSSPVLLPGGRALQAGKAGVAYLVDAAHLGGVGGQLATATVCRGAGVYGGAAVAADTVYLPCRDGLRAVKVTGTTLTVAWSAAGDDPGAPVVAGGLVWTVDRTGTLSGRDPSTGALRRQASVGPVSLSFPTMAAGGGRLIVPTGSTVVCMNGV